MNDIERMRARLAEAALVAKVDDVADLASHYVNATPDEVEYPESIVALMVAILGLTDEIKMSRSEAIAVFTKLAHNVVLKVSRG